MQTLQPREIQVGSRVQYYRSKKEGVVEGFIQARKAYNQGVYYDKKRLSGTCLEVRMDSGVVAYWHKSHVRLVD